MEAAPWGLLLAPQAAMAAQAGAQPFGWLSDSEQHRLAGLRTAARQSVFVACRFALRQLLVEGGGAVEAWRLGSCAERAPWVEREAGHMGPGTAPLLSLSHSGGWIACAKAPVPIGVDLEVQPASRVRDVQALSALVCAPAEQEWLLSQSVEVQQQGFLQLWCLKEAYFKCLGIGLDLEKIRRSSWRMHPASSVPDGAKRAHAPNTALAHARVWLALTDDGAWVCIALCALDPLPELTPSVDGPAFHWQSVTEWSLCAVAERLEQL